MAINKVRFLLFICLIITSVSLSCQTLKVDSARYKGWYNLINQGLSDDGNWSYFSKIFDDNKQEGVLINTKTKKVISYPHGVSYYLDNEVFVQQGLKGRLYFRNLKNASEKIYDNAESFQYNKSADIFIIKMTNEVLLINRKGKVTNSFHNISKIEMFENAPGAIVFFNNDIGILNASEGKIFTVHKYLSGDSLLTTSYDSQRSVFKLLMRSGDKRKAYYYDHNGVEVLKKDLDENFNTYERFDFLSNDILVASKPYRKTKKAAEDSVEIWSNRDKALKPFIMDRFNNAEEILVSDISGKISFPNPFINNESRSYFVFGNKYLLTVMGLENIDYNGRPVLPNVQLKNVATNMVEFELSKVENIHPSVIGKYLLYFKEKNWRLYDVTSKRTINITENLPGQFYYFNRPNTKVPLPIAKPFFSQDYNQIYLTSDQGVWEYNIPSNITKQIFVAPDRNSNFIIQEDYQNTFSKFLEINNNHVVNQPYFLLKSSRNNDLEDGLLLLKENNIATVEEPCKFSFDQWKMNSNFISYIKRNANTPDQLILYDIRKGKKRIIFQSNGENMKLTLLPKAEVFKWKDDRGNENYTTVILPPDYNPKKKYPGIVHIYENKAKEFKDFVSPTFYNEEGFNRSTTAMQRYIVILPRIIYKTNLVGQSAVDSVEEAVMMVAKQYNLDTKNLGLIGHSFGGYETNFIMSHSKMFKTAISGAGISDVTGEYFTVNQNFFYANSGRYTNGQYHFSDNFFKISNAYFENNPIFVANRIEAPMLIWSGKKDYQVYWKQSISMFMALASSNKEVRLLLFPKEEHALESFKNQKKATTMFLEWFNYYLKSGTVPSWL